MADNECVGTMLQRSDKNNMYIHFVPSQRLKTEYINVSML